MVNFDILCIILSLLVIWLKTQCWDLTLFAFRTSSSITPTNSLTSIPFQKEFEDEETIKANILQRTRVVLSSRESSQIFDEIWNKKEPIAIDCEGISLGTKGQLTTIQVSFLDFDQNYLMIYCTPKCLILCQPKFSFYSTLVCSTQCSLANYNKC
jgi:hypothetical protein